MKNKPVASLSLDLDNQWSYMKTHGDKDWDKYPSYLHIFLPYILDIFDELNIKITFFIVGKDAAIESNQPYIAAITKRGHDVGNHSFNHEVWLSTYSKEEVHRELEQAEQIIEKVTGKKPIGFRGPGFSWSPALFDTLIERGYKYDGSTLPTFLGPLARLYFFLTSNFTKEERKKRKDLFGNFKEGFRPVRPYFWKINGNKLLEIPVTTIPILKIPFHISYLLYLSRISKYLMMFYLNISLFFCRLTRTQPTILLHPLDLISGDQIPELKFFPGMDIPSSKKTETFKLILKKLQKHYNLKTLNEHYFTLDQSSIKKVVNF